MNMEYYQENMKAIERERINFLTRIDLVRPSFEEQHQLEWERRYQEEELHSLRSELVEVSQEVEAEATRLREREEIIREIRSEQLQDRVKIQTLLALSQPITPDITVVLQSLAPNSPSPRSPLRSSSRGLHPSSTSSFDGRDQRGVCGSMSPSGRAGARPRKAAVVGGARRHPNSDNRGVVRISDSVGWDDSHAEDDVSTRAAAEEERSALPVQDADAWENVSGGSIGLQKNKQQQQQQRRGPSRRTRRRDDGRGGRGSGGSGGSGGNGQYSPGDELTGGGTRDYVCSNGSEEDAHQQQGAGRGQPSYGLVPGRQWSSETSSGGGGGETGTRQHLEGKRSGASSTAMATDGRGGGDDRGNVGRGRREGVRGGRRGRRRSRSGGTEGRSEGVGGARKDGISTGLRCTRGYQEHLERRLDLTQRHLRELDDISESYQETLDRDRQEREIQARVQKENVAAVLESLRKRLAEADRRVEGATDDYLRLRHRAKEAHAASLQEQRQCVEDREKSRSQVARLLAASEEEVEAIKQEGRLRLDGCTIGLRDKLGAAEEVLQRERAHHAGLKERFEERVSRARGGVLSTRRRHNKLVRRRAHEVVHLSDEMAALRRGVTELERRMFAGW